ncbi:TATA box-binding protein-associated factor RNA polymerase I subunit B isoform X1 [Tanacetum coccineum]
MTNGLRLICKTCGPTEAECDGGIYYFQCCGAQAYGIVQTAVDNEENILTQENVGGLVKRRLPAVKTEQLSQSQPLSQFWQTLQTQENNAEAGDGCGPSEPTDFRRESRTLREEDYYSEIRMRYVMGVQIMLELQIKALVDKFNVSPIILDLVFADDWAKEVIKESESQGEIKGVGPTAKHEAEPHNSLGKRSVMIWYRSVRKTIPLWYSLVISFLVCHLAREPILSTDIIKWALEGKLPYFVAFVEIDEQIGPPTNACPLSSSLNFYAIASRYLRQLSLPVETILPHACRIYEWSMPSELWLSANEFRLPTHSFVLSILIVAIRILYNIHGFGKWEMSLSSDTKRKDEKKSKKLDVFAGKDEEAEFECNVDVNSGVELSSLSNNRDISEPCTSSQSGVSYTGPYNELPKQSNLDATDILHVLHSKYNKLIDTSGRGIVAIVEGEANGGLGLREGLLGVQT